MKFDGSQLLLYGITDSKWAEGRSFEEMIEESLKGGVTMIQLREKSLSKDEFVKRACSIKKLCADFGVPFLINDNVDVAKQVDADGVHLGQNDMSPVLAREILGEDKIIGVTAKTLDQALKAEADRADYIGCGACFTTSTKHDAIPISLEKFNEICSAINIPAVAIGGINSENLSQLKGLKSHGFAISEGLYSAESVEKKAAELKKLAIKTLNL